ncbi:MAG: hypothetical protein IPI46_11985 [Bacteroidetes bacterium]|nr:hypothetical protein [Bacteroidota bacterium]
MVSQQSKWLTLSLFNLSIVALAGFVLRYKIVYSLPFIDQKHLLHGHSHFAFAGWISLALMTFMIGYLAKHGLVNSFASYRSLLVTQVIASYGMLISFPIQGYGLFSISFSTLSILVSYIFMFRFWRDVNKLNYVSVAHAWFKAALLFNSLSSLGAFSLAFMMANQINHQNWYLSAVYFFLHFQYNGWFFFACMGLFISTCENLGIPTKPTKIIYQIFVLACIPTYYLSALWMPMYTAVYMMVVISASAQFIGLYLFAKFLFNHRAIFSTHLSKPALVILFMSFIAFSIKISLQLGSTYPPLSELAFGFRPIVIAYLHLVLLGMISTFLLGNMLVVEHLQFTNVSKWGIGIFISGIIVNECILMAQGIAGISYESLPYTNESLLIAAGSMYTGILLVVIGSFLSNKNAYSKS